MNRFGNKFGVLFAIAALGLAGCTHKAPEAAVTRVVSGLSIAHAQEQPVSSSVEAIGTVHARESVVLSAQVMGRITSIAAHEGDAVRTGQLLVTTHQIVYYKE